jgi:hypothetical protein
MATADWVADDTYKITCPGQYPSSCKARAEELCSDGYKVKLKDDSFLSPNKLVIECKSTK